MEKPRKWTHGPTTDPHYAAAVERVKAATRELQSKGIIDANGRRIRKDMPADIVIAGPASDLLAHCKL